MTTGAKIPKTSTNLQPMNIYLFSNGQEYSPPRKYHLRSEEFTWWEATLMRLARSQYGSLHSNIELYTLDGLKVDDPQQLTNGTAYVAVVPPDAFIDSGYSEYMIKATRDVKIYRSWEKSQARRSYGYEMNKSGEVLNETIVSPLIENTNLAPEKIENENNISETIPALIGGSINTILRPYTDADIKKPKYLTPLPKVHEKKRQTFSQYSPSVRKISDTVSFLSKKRSSMTSKKDFISKNDSKVQRLQTTDKLASCKKMVIKKTISSYNNKTLSVTSKVKGQPIDSNTVSISRQTKSVNSASIIDNIHTEATIFQNPDSDMKSVIVIQENNNSINAESNGKRTLCDITEKIDVNEPILKQTVDTIPETISHGESAATYTNDTMLSHKIFIDPVPHSPNVTFSNKHNDDNYIIIKKGDVINLKLHIEVETEDCNSATYNVNNFRSLRKILKTDRESQVNVEDEILAHSKSLQSLFVNEVTQNVDETGNSKFVIVNCETHCNYDVSKVDAVLSQNAKKYFVMLATSKYEEQKACSCDHIFKGKKETVEKNDENAKKLNICDSLQKRTSNLSLKKLMNLEEPPHITRFTDQEIPTTGNKWSLHNKNSTSNMDVDSHCNESKTGDVNFLPKRIVGPSDLPKIEDNREIEFADTKKSTEESMKTFVDKAVQTEWLNALLQAKRQDDGYYTFHLPPLHLLKYYNIF